MDKLIHRSQHRVLYGDTDAAAVVYNANYLRYFELGRTEFMRDRVCTYREIEQLGIILPVTECHIRFKAPARYDDLLIIETFLTELKKGFLHLQLSDSKRRRDKQATPSGQRFHHPCLGQSGRKTNPLANGNHPKPPAAPPVSLSTARRNPLTLTANVL